MFLPDEELKSMNRSNPCIRQPLISCVEKLKDIGIKTLPCIFSNVEQLRKQHLEDIFGYSQNVNTDVWWDN